MTDLNCSECKKKPLAEHSSLEAGICENQKFKRILKKWSIVAMLAVAFATPLTFFDAQAQAEIQLFDQSGNEIVLTQQSIQTITLPAGSWIHGTVTGRQTVTSDLSDFQATTDMYGTSTFSGQVRDTQSTLQLGEYTVLMEPQQFPLNMTEIVLIGVCGVVGVGALVARRRG